MSVSLRMILSTVWKKVSENLLFISFGFSYARKNKIPIRKSIKQLIFSRSIFIPCFALNHSLNLCYFLFFSFVFLALVDKRFLISLLIISGWIRSKRNRFKNCASFFPSLVQSRVKTKIIRSPKTSKENGGKLLVKNEYVTLR